MHATTAILDQPCVLQFASKQRNARALDAEHMGDSFLSDKKLTAATRVVRTQKPRAQSLNYRVFGDAARGLLGLR